MIGEPITFYGNETLLCVNYRPLFKVPSLVVTSSTRFNCISYRLNRKSLPCYFLCLITPIKFKILVLTFKAIHRIAPSYIINVINIKHPSDYSLRRNNELLLDFPRGIISKRTLGDRAFCLAAPGLWNALPTDIRDCTILYQFRVALKTYLFKESFY